MNQDIIVFYWLEIEGLTAVCATYKNIVSIDCAIGQIDMRKLINKWEFDQ